MKLNEMYPSKFMSKDDAPVVATIKNVVREEIKGDNGNEMKNVVHFQGNVKPMILNKGNAVMLTEAYGDDSIGWHGKPVEIYLDPNVMFGGKRVGGLRVRVPQGGGAAPPPPDDGTGERQFWLNTGQGTMSQPVAESWIREKFADANDNTNWQGAKVCEVGDKTWKRLFDVLSDLAGPIPF